MSNTSEPTGMAAESPQAAASRSWMAHLAKVPSAREPDEDAATDKVRLQGYIVQALVSEKAGATSRLKTWRFRLVRESDCQVVYDCREFGPKLGMRNRIKKAIEAEYEISLLLREKAPKE